MSAWTIIEWWLIMLRSITQCKVSTLQITAAPWMHFCGIVSTMQSISTETLQQSRRVLWMAWSWSRVSDVKRPCCKSLQYFHDTKRQPTSAKSIVERFCSIVFNAKWLLITCQSEKPYEWRDHAPSRSSVMSAKKKEWDSRSFPANAWSCLKSRLVHVSERNGDSMGLNGTQWDSMDLQIDTGDSMNFLPPAP
jgi:hypothetical protein